MAKEFREPDQLNGPDALRVFRARRRISQEDFGRLIGMRGPAISDYERGASRPDLTTATKIERVTEGAVPAISWVDPAKLQQLGQHVVDHDRQANETTAARRTA